MVISGWVLDLDDPRKNPEAELLVNGRLVCRFRMHLMHPAIEQTLKLPPGTLGPVGFSMKLPAVACLSGKHVFSMRCPRTHQTIGRPCVFEHRASYEVFSGAPTINTKPQTNLAIAHPVRRAPSSSLSRSPLKHARKALAAAKQRPLVSAIILNRDGADCLQALLSSWYRYNSVAAELIIIDHASQDDSYQVVQDWSQRLDIRWVGLSCNDSFSASSNRGARLAKAPNLLFLNNDIVWVQDVLPAMLQTLQQSTQVAVGLKLLRHDAQHTGLPDLASAPVQHLGVRLTLSEHVYWPYECSPENSSPKDELFAPQAVPAVTAAVMLMRARDFWRIGGFDERYFYGYEDVELCLRAVHSGHRRHQITCRNDLVALHRHGHSRLSGRQPDVTRKLSVNQQVFAQALGLWSKQAWWQSLLRQDGLLCGDTLTLGIVYDDCPLELTGDLSRDVASLDRIRQSPQAAQAKAQAEAWAERLQKVFGSARLLLYPRSAGWADFSQAHLLWVLAPEWAHKSGSRMRREIGLRADCRAVAVLNAQNLAQWQHADSSALCGAMVEPGTSLAQAEAAWSGRTAVWDADASDALQRLANHHMRLFIAMHVDGTDRPSKTKARVQVLANGQMLAQVARRLGMLVESETFMPGDQLALPVAELVVHIWPSSATGQRREADGLQDALHVAWITGGLGRGTSHKALQGFEHCWCTEPLPVASTAGQNQKIRQLRVQPVAASVQAALKTALKTVEQRIGRAFSAP